MVKLIRANQKTFLAGLTILSMITFLVSYGNKGTGDHAVADRPYGTINGKTIYTSEVTEAHNELSALKGDLDFSRLDNPATRDSRGQFMQALIRNATGGSNNDWFMLLRHEANDAAIQISNDDIETVLSTYADGKLRTDKGELNPDADNYAITYNGVASLLKIMARYEQVAGMLKISKPAVDADMVRTSESISLDLIQYAAGEFLAAVPPPTTQELQGQFTKYAAVEPHHPDPTTNPSGIGYRLPVRTKLQYVCLTPREVNAAIAAIKFQFPAPDWEVQARKYYLAHPDEFPTTAPTTSPAASPTSSPTTAAVAAAIATTLPTGPRPFAAVHDEILAKIREPMVTSLSEQVKNYIASTLNNDWQAYSVFINSGKPGPEPASSLGVPYTSPVYLTKLSEAVESKFDVKIAVGETAGGLSQDQIAKLPDIGTPELAELAMSLANDYLDRTSKADKSAPAWLCHPSAPTDGPDKTSTIVFRLSEVQPSEPAPNLDAVRSQLETDVRTASAYKLAQTKARDIIANMKDRPLFLVADAKNPLVHIDRLSMFDHDVPKVTPDLGAATASFIKQAYELLSTYDPSLNRNPSEVIELPEQARVFAAQLSFVDASWNSESYFDTVLGVRRRALTEEQQFLQGGWFNPQAVSRRLSFVSIAKNKSSDSE